MATSLSARAPEAPKGARTAKAVRVGDLAWFRALVRAGAVAGGLAALGCGKKLDPEPPLLLVPERPASLRVVQESAEAVLRFPYPSRTVQGAPLTDLTRVTVYREVLPASAGAAPPATPDDAAARAREERLFFARAEKVAELTRKDLDAKTFGADVIHRDPLEKLFTDPRLGKVFLRYGVVATRDARRDSDVSPLVSILPRVPPGPPAELSVVVEETRVRLDWKAPAAKLDGTKPAEVAAYAVYRRDEETPEYVEPLAMVAQGTTYADGTAVLGRKYRYTVRASASATPPLVLGPGALEIPVDTRDIFPPPVPEGVLVLSESSGNRIVWNPVLVDDLSAYHVYRLDPGKAEWARVGAGLKDASHFDRGAPAGARYGVTSVDRAGNESARGEPAIEKGTP